MDEEVEGGRMVEVAGCGKSEEEEKEKGPTEIITRSEHNNERRGDRGAKAKCVFI